MTGLRYLQYLPEGLDSSSSSGGANREGDTNDDTYGYVSTKRVPLNSLDRTQTPRGSIIPDTCFETKVAATFIKRRHLKSSLIK